MLHSGSALYPETAGATAGSRAEERCLTGAGLRSTQAEAAEASRQAAPQEVADGAGGFQGLPVSRPLFSALTTPPQLLSRLWEQTLLVRKLTEQNADKEETISSLRTEVQEQVRGTGRGAARGGGIRTPLSSLPPPAGVPSQWRPGGPGRLEG